MIVKQRKYNQKSLANILPHQFKKGQSGNPNGRPKGKTLKEYSREMLAAMTEEERQEFLHGIDKETIWKLAEGNPTQSTELSGKLEVTGVKVSVQKK